MKRAAECAKCEHHRLIPGSCGASELVCLKGHRPRFYAPKMQNPFIDDGLRPVFKDKGGYRRRCSDFEEKEKP